MKKHLAFMLIALIFAYGFPVSYASVDSSPDVPNDEASETDDSDGEGDEDNTVTDTNAPAAIPSTPAQTGPGDLSKLPAGIDPQAIKEVGMPADGRFEGFEINPATGRADEGRLYLRSVVGISGSEMKAMDDFVKTLKNNPTAWNEGFKEGVNDGMCWDAVNVAFYKLYSQNPMIYAGGPMPPGVDGPTRSLQNYVNSGAYAPADTVMPPKMTDVGGTSSEIIPGTIAIGGETFGLPASDPRYKLHIATYWKTDENVANNQSGTWVAQKAGDQNWDNYIGTKPIGSIYPVARPDGTIYNPDGFPIFNGVNGKQAAGWVTLPKRWTINMDQYHSQSGPYGTIPLNSIRKS